MSSITACAVLLPSDAALSEGWRPCPDVSGALVRVSHTNALAEAVEAVEASAVAALEPLEAPETEGGSQQVDAELAGLENRGVRPRTKRVRTLIDKRRQERQKCDQACTDSQFSSRVKKTRDSRSTHRLDETVLLW